MSVLETMLGVGSLILGPARAVLKSLSGPPLWLKLDIGSVVRKIETGTKIRGLEFTLQMVNEEPSRPIRVDGVTLVIPFLAGKQEIATFEGRLGNKHWSQSWPLHLRSDKAILRMYVPTSVNNLPESLVVKAVIRIPRGLRRKKVVSVNALVTGLK